MGAGRTLGAPHPRPSPVTGRPSHGEAPDGSTAGPRPWGPPAVTQCVPDRPSGVATIASTGLGVRRARGVASPGGTLMGLCPDPGPRSGVPIQLEVWAPVLLLGVLRALCPLLCRAEAGGKGRGHSMDKGPVVGCGREGKEGPVLTLSLPLAFFPGLGSWGTRAPDPPSLTWGRAPTRASPPVPVS